MFQTTATTIKKKVSTTKEYKTKVKTYNRLKKKKVKKQKTKKTIYC